MSTMEYVGFASAVIAIIGVLGGWIQYLHNIRTTDLKAHRESVDKRLSELDADVDGLAQQMAADTLDHERRYITKDDHAKSNNILTDAVRGVSDQLRTLDNRIFQLLRRNPDDRSGG